MKRNGEIRRLKWGQYLAYKPRKGSKKAATKGSKRQQKRQQTKPTTKSVRERSQMQKSSMKNRNNEHRDFTTAKLLYKESTPPLDGTAPGGHPPRKDTPWCPSWGSREWKSLARELVESPVRLTRLARMFKVSPTTIKKRITSLLTLNIVVRVRRGIYDKGWRYTTFQEGEFYLDLFGSVTPCTHPYIKTPHHDGRERPRKDTNAGGPLGVSYLDLDLKPPRRVPIRLHNIAFKFTIERAGNAKLEVPWGPWVKWGKGVFQRFFEFPVKADGKTLGTGTLQQFWSQKKGESKTLVLRFPELYFEDYVTASDAENRLLLYVFGFRDWLARQYGLMLSHPHQMTRTEAAAEHHPEATEERRGYRIETPEGDVVFVDASKGKPEVEGIFQDDIGPLVDMVHAAEENQRRDEIIRRIANTQSMVVKVLNKIATSNTNDPPRDDRRGYQ